MLFPSFILSDARKYSCFGAFSNVYLQEEHVLLFSGWNDLDWHREALCLM